MPHPKILKVLGMSPAQWGELAVESVSNIRNEMKEKAVALIKADEEQQANNGLNYRVSALEALVKNAVTNDNSELENGLAQLQSTVSHLVSKCADLESRLAKAGG